MPRIGKKTISAVMRALARRRRTNGGGRPPILRPCPHCGTEFSARQLRAHITHCQAR